jgi:hypothetical protein
MTLVNQFVQENLLANKYMHLKFVDSIRIYEYGIYGDINTGTVYLFTNTCIIMIHSNEPVMHFYTSFKSGLTCTSWDIQ